MVIDLKDDWMETQGYRGRSPIVRWVERRMEKGMLGSAERLIAATQQSLVGLRARLAGQGRNRLTLIPNGTDLAEYAAAPKADDLTRSLFRMVCAFGGYGRNYRDVTPLFEAIERLRKSAPEVARRLEILFLGQGLAKEYGDRLAASARGDVVREESPRSRQEFVRLMRTADLFVAVQPQGCRTSVSATVYEYWAVGGPPIMLISDAGATRSFVNDHALGAVFGPSDLEGICAYLSGVWKEWASGKPRRISLSGVEQFDRKKLADKLGQ